MNNRKKLDLGNSNFKSIIESNNYFIDKSLLIEEIINAEKQVILLPRPRRFGKTLNLSMLKSFFKINKPEDVNLFKDLKIWQTTDEIKEKHGKFPTIFISFKDAKELNWAETYELIISEIAFLYENFNYLIDNQIISEDEIEIFKKIKNKTASKIDYENSIKNLSKYLYKFHNQKVVILIDEYDTPIQASYKKFYAEAISFMRNLLSGAFKDNDFLYKGVITGILRVSRESIFTGLNNVSVYSIMDNEFSDKFGFTENETLQIIKDFEIKTNYEEIKYWYDGYKFGNTENIYNPWSILNFVLSKSGFKTFWGNTSSNDMLKDRINEKNINSTRNEILKLLKNETIEKSIEENFVFPDLDTDKELIWTLLVFSGYLTPTTKTGRNLYKLSIPNYEIFTVFQDIIIDWFNIEIKITHSLLYETTKYLINNEIQKFEEGFKQIIGDTFSYFDIDGEPEKVYQAYILGLLAIIGDEYIIKSNRESGEGRYDIMLIPHNKSKNGVVIEIKQITRSKTETDNKFNQKINKKIQQAIEQIDNNQYYKELIENKVANIIKLPIIFCGKQPFITQRIIKKKTKKIES